MGVSQMLLCQGPPVSKELTLTASSPRKMKPVSSWGLHVRWGGGHTTGRVQGRIQGPEALGQARTQGEPPLSRVSRRDPCKQRREVGDGKRRLRGSRCAQARKEATVSGSSAEHQYGAWRAVGEPGPSARGPRHRLQIPSATGAAPGAPREEGTLL